MADQTMTSPQPSEPSPDLLKQTPTPGDPSVDLMQPDLSIQMPAQESQNPTAEILASLSSPALETSPTRSPISDSSQPTEAPSYPGDEAPSSPEEKSSPSDQRPDQNPLLRLLHGPIAVEDLAGQEIVDKMAGDWLEDPEFQVEQMLRDLDQQESQGKAPLVPLFWKDSPEKFVEEYNQSMQGPEETGLPNLEYDNNLKAGLRQGNQPSDTSSLLLTLSAGKASRQQLNRLEVLLAMWHEHRSPLTSQETPTPASS